MRPVSRIKSQHNPLGCAGPGKGGEGMYLKCAVRHNTHWQELEEYEWDSVLRCLSKKVSKTLISGERIGLWAFLGDRNLTPWQGTQKMGGTPRCWLDSDAQAKMWRREVVGWVESRQGHVGRFSWAAGLGLPAFEVTAGQKLHIMLCPSETLPQTPSYRSMAFKLLNTFSLWKPPPCFI